MMRVRATKAALASASQAIAIDGLQFPLEALAKLLGGFEGVSETKKELEAFCERLSRILQMLEPMMQTTGPSSAGHQLSPAVMTRLEVLSRRLTDVAKEGDKLKTYKLASRVVRDEETRSILERLNTKLDSILSEFLIKGSLSIEDVLHKVDITVTERLDQGLRISEAQHAEVMSAVHSDPFISLPKVDAHFSSAENSSTTRCLEGTRTAVLQEISDWINNRDSACPRIFWLNGAAGMGKSTIAQTIAELSDEKDELFASFFFSRDDAKRSDSLLFFPTIAYQMAHFDDINPHYRLAVQEVLRTRPNIGRDAVRFQFRNLFTKPLQSLPMSPPRPLVIVVDALDECVSDVSAAEILVLMSQAVPHLPLNLKIFVTSRPAHHISAKFEALVDGSLSNQLVLHDIEKIVVRHDIFQYLRHHLSKIAGEMRSRDKSLTGDWPRKDDVETLADKSNGLFIFAATAIKFIRDARDPRQQLRYLLATGPMATASQQASLDWLYLQVLSQDDSANDNFQTVVGTIALLRSPLSADALSRFLHIDISSVNAAITHLRSVIIVPKAPASDIRVLHPSFTEFLTQSDRCSDARFFVEPRYHHSRIANLCLAHMLSSLQRDICGIKDPSRLNSEIEDLPERLEQCIRKALQYSCFNWAYHLARSGPLQRADDVLVKSLEKFTKTKLLYWVEVLSLFGALDLAVNALSEMEQWFKTMSTPEHNTRELLQDCLRLILAFYDAIHLSAAHIYHSALPFAPLCGLTRIYSFEANGSVKAMFKRSQGWSTNVRTMEGHDLYLNSAAFSTDGTRIATGSDDETVCLWEATSGGLLEQMTGHTAPVVSVAFSPDGTKLASCGWNPRGKGSVYLWNTITGSCIGSMQSLDPIFKVTFSCDNILIGGGAKNCLSLWDVASGTEIDNFAFGPAGSLGTDDALAFSPDISRPGYRVAIGANRTVWLYDTALKESQKIDIRPYDGGGGGGNISCIRYSLDGHRLIFSTDRQAVHIWDPVRMQCLHIIDQAFAEASLSPTIQILPDNGRFATALGLWSMDSGERVTEFSRELGDHVFGLAFSPDASFVGVFIGHALQLWTSCAPSSPHTPPLSSGTRLQSLAQFKLPKLMSRHPRTVPDETPELYRLPPVWAYLHNNQEVFCTALSLDNTRILCGMTDGSIEVWDVFGSRRLSKTGRRASHVTAVTYSPGGDFFAAAWHNVLELWDATSFKCRSNSSFSSQSQGRITCITFPRAWRIGMEIAVLSTDLSWCALWNPLNNTWRKVAESERVSSVTFCQTEKRVFILTREQSPDTVDVWQLGEININSSVKVATIGSEIMRTEGDAFVDAGWLLVRNQHGELERMCWLPTTLRPAKWCPNWKTGKFVGWSTAHDGATCSYSLSTGVLVDLSKRL